MNGGWKEKVVEVPRLERQKVCRSIETEREER